MWIAGAALLVAAACSESIFDSNVGKDDGGTSTSIDGGGDGDGGGTGRECPASCQGDPVGDFSMTQGGSTGRWFYFEDTRTSPGATYVEMETGTYQGENAWLGTGGAPPAIVRCQADSASEVCAGAGESLVFVPSSTVATDTDPVLGFLAPTNGSYHLEGSFKSPQAGGVPHHFLVSRNSRNDLLHKENFATIAEATSFSLDVEAVQGDMLLLTMPSNQAGTAEPVAFDFYVTLLSAAGAVFPGACQFAVTFDDEANPLADHCGGAAFDSRDYDSADPVNLATEVVSLNTRYGKAREFVEDNYMVSTGPPMDYSGDFTVQFWIKLAVPQPSFGTVGFSDEDNGVPGGIGWYFGSDSDSTDACYFWPGGGTAGGCFSVNGTHVGVDGEWHFYRISRTGDTLEACVDGTSIGSTTATAGSDMGSNQAVRLGRNFGPAYFGGSIDDVRIFKRGLPCN